MFMYFPDPARIPPAEAGLDGVEEIELAAGDGTTLVAWYAPAKDGKPTILYFHGNAANAANRAPKIDMMLEDGFGVFYLNNRGYGGSAGSPTEANNVADAIAAYDRSGGLGVPPSSIVAYGESLGSGQAVRLAAERPVAAVVLEAPLTSTVDVARPVYFWLPLSLLITDQYNVERDITRRHGPAAHPARRAGRGDPGGDGPAHVPRRQRAETHRAVPRRPPQRSVRPRRVGEDARLSAFAGEIVRAPRRSRSSR